jgi:hypothetical protein
MDDRRVETHLQTSRKWHSSSISPERHILHNLSFRGVIGLVYRPVSMANLWLLERILAKERLCVSIVTSERYCSKQKLF